jgi:hypothetical protein
MKVCKDCVAQGITSKREAKYPGPRCTTHHRERKRAVSTSNHARRVENTYGITGEEYQAIYDAQGGRCYICQRATGARRRLAVDHDHTCTAGHDPNVGCRLCVRGLCCKQCNYILLGRYSVEMLRRAISYLNDPPAQHVLMEMD